MKKLLLNLTAAILTVFAIAGISSLAPVQSTYAVKHYCPNGKPTTDLKSCEDFSDLDEGAKKADVFSVANTAVNVILSVIGVVAVVVIIIGGITFMTSQGDSNKVAKGRNTLIWGVVGLVVALVASAIVNFVLKNVFK